MKRNILLDWFLVLFWCGIIFYLSHQPDLGIGWGIWDFLLRKLAHILEFGVLAFLLWRPLSYSVNFKNALIFMVILSLFYASLDEFHQYFIEGRSGNVIDVFIDSFGILVTFGIILLKTKVKK